MSHISLIRLFNSNLAKKCRRIGGTMFNKYLLLTNVGISITLSGVGDILQQNYEIITDKREKWDRIRTHHMSISGMTVGIICHNWYKVLDRALPGRTLAIVMKKVVVDQIICSPICITAFFLTLGYLEKSTWKEVKQEIISKGHRLYVAEWVIWPPAQIVNFYVLPTRFRVLYDNTISLGYDVYTSYVKHDTESYDLEDNSSKPLKENINDIL